MPRKEITPDTKIAIKKYRQRYYMDHADEFREKARVNYWKNRERCIASSRAWKEKHKTVAAKCRSCVFFSIVREPDNKMYHRCVKHNLTFIEDRMRVCGNRDYVIRESSTLNK